MLISKIWIIQTQDKLLTGKTLKTMRFDTITINSSSINKKFVSVTTLISNEEMDILKIVKSLEETGLLIKGVSQTIKNKAK